MESMGNFFDVVSKMESKKMESKKYDLKTWEAFYAFEYLYELKVAILNFQLQVNRKTPLRNRKGQLIKWTLKDIQARIKSVMDAPIVKRVIDSCGYPFPFPKKIEELESCIFFISALISIPTRILVEWAQSESRKEKENEKTA